MNILILNGPNLNLLGKREPEVYGHTSFGEYYKMLKEELEANHKGLKLDYFQSNHEGALLDKLHELGFSCKGIVFNAGAYTHTSVALRDAIAGISTPVVEVHISNVFKREAFRHHSYMAPCCVGSISGLGLEGYRLAIEYFLRSKK